MIEDPVGKLGSSLKSERIQLKSERIQLKSERIQLKSERIQERLEEVVGWALGEQEGELVKTYALSSQRAAVAFAGFAAQVAEDLGHSPRITIEGARVSIRTSTEEAEGLSDTDFDLARWIDRQEI